MTRRAFFAALLGGPLLLRAEVPNPEICTRCKKEPPVLHTPSGKVYCYGCSHYLPEER